MENANQDDFEVEGLEQYWLEHVKDQIVDKAQDDDSDLVNKHKVYLGFDSKHRVKKSANEKSPSVIKQRRPTESSPNSNLSSRKSQNLAPQRRQRSARVT